jgi:hypothetical protein
LDPQCSTEQIKIDRFCERKYCRERYLTVKTKSSNLVIFGATYYNVVARLRSYAVKVKIGSRKICCRLMGWFHQMTVTNILRRRKHSYHTIVLNTRECKKLQYAENGHIRSNRWSKFVSAAKRRAV